LSQIILVNGFKKDFPGQATWGKLRFSRLAVISGLGQKEAKPRAASYPGGLVFR
jgi:hypothetical protein